MPIDRIKRQAFWGDESGAVAVIVGLSLVVLLGFVALGVDVAWLYRERAQLQSASDLTAISAMADPANASQRAVSALERNDRAEEVLSELQTGRFLRNPAIAAADRFTALPPGSPGINAVAVQLTDLAPIHFARVFSSATGVELRRRAMATRTGAASFALDSHIARFQGSALSEALSDRLGVSVELSAAETQILAETAVNLSDFLNALDQALGLEDRNPAAILDATSSVSAYLNAAQSVVSPVAANVIASLPSVAGSTDLVVSSLVGGLDSELGLTATEFLAEIEITALDLLQALVASRASNVDSSTGGSLSVPGVSHVQAELRSGEPAAQSGWIALGEEGVQLHRAAARMRADVTFAPDLMGGLGVGVSVTALKLPVHVELAGATATLDEINCRLPQSQDIAARFLTAPTPLHPANGTSVAALYLGELPQSDAGQANPADLGFADILTFDVTVSLPLLPDLVVENVILQARSAVAAGQSQTDVVTFSRGEIEAGDMVKGFGSGELLSSAVQDLLSPETTEIRLKPGQDSLLAGLAGPVITEALELAPAQLSTALVAPLDNVLDQLLADAGLRVGEGELTLNGHHCELIRLTL